MLQTFLISLLIVTGSYCTPSPAKEEVENVNDKATTVIIEEIEPSSVEPTTEISNPAPAETTEIQIPPNTQKPSPTKTPTAFPKEAHITPEKEKSVPPPAPSSPTTDEESEAPGPQTETTATAPKQEENIKDDIAEERELTLSPPDHSAWDALLQKYVNSQGMVNYQGFKKDKAALDAYLENLSNNPVQSAWSGNEQLAYWINVYNAYTIKLIVDNYPVSSITKLKGGKPWDVKWIKLGTKTYSLNQVENEIIRPQFKEPRIHFAVNCAALSCPPLLNRAWTADKLNANFNRTTKAFINNPTFNKITAGKIQVSKIFDWYGEDFGNLIGYLNKYSDTKIRSNAKVEFLEYDWALNKQ